MKLGELIKVLQDRYDDDNILLEYRIQMKPLGGRVVIVRNTDESEDETEKRYWSSDFTWYAEEDVRGDCLFVFNGDEQVEVEDINKANIDFLLGSGANFTPTEIAVADYWLKQIQAIANISTQLNEFQAFMDSAFCGPDVSVFRGFKVPAKKDETVKLMKDTSDVEQA